MPPYAETRLYVLKLLAAVAGQTTHPYDATATPPSPVLPLMRGATATGRTGR